MPPLPTQAVKLDVQTVGSAFVGIAVFFILLLVAIYRAFKIFSNSLKKDLPLAKAYHVFLIMFLVCRIAWIALSVLLDSFGQALDFEVGFTINRAAFLFFWTAYTLMVFHWIEIFHRSYQLRTNQALPRLMPLFLLVNILMYSYQIGTVIKLYYDHKQEGDPWYDTNILVIVVCFLLLSLGFLIYGGAMLHRLERSRRVVGGGGGAGSSASHGVGKKVMYAMGLFAGCFSGRVVMFSWRLITNGRLPEVVFFVFGYIVPELFPSIYQVYLMRRVERSAATARAMAHLKEMRTQPTVAGEEQEAQEREALEAPEQAHSRGYRGDSMQVVDIPAVYDEAEDIDVDMDSTRPSTTVSGAMEDHSRPLLQNAM